MANSITAQDGAGVPSLADDLVGLDRVTSRGRGPRCRVAEVLAQIEERDPVAAGRFTAAADDVRVLPRVLVERMERHGFDLSQYTVKRHRRRLLPGGDGCRCPK